MVEEELGGEGGVALYVPTVDPKERYGLALERDGQVALVLVYLHHVLDADGGVDHERSADLAGPRCGAEVGRINETDGGFVNREEDDVVGRLRGKLHSDVVGYLFLIVGTGVEEPSGLPEAVAVNVFPGILETVVVEVFADVDEPDGYIRPGGGGNVGVDEPALIELIGKRSPRRRSDDGDATVELIVVGNLELDSVVVRRGVRGADADKEVGACICAVEAVEIAHVDAFSRIDAGEEDALGDAVVIRVVLLIESPPDLAPVQAHESVDGDVVGAVQIPVVEYVLAVVVAAVSVNVDEEDSPDILPACVEERGPGLDAEAGVQDYLVDAGGESLVAVAVVEKRFAEAVFVVAVAVVKKDSVLGAETGSLHRAAAESGHDVVGLWIDGVEVGAAASGTVGVDHVVDDGVEGPDVADGLIVDPEGYARFDAG